MDGFQELTPPLTREETIMTHNQVQDLHEKYCKQESRISKLEASDQFQNKQLEKLIQKMEQQHGTQPAMRGWICLRQLDPCAERIRKELSFCLRKHIRQTRCSH